MVVELLSHCTPPACISANILTVAELIHPNHSIVRELPSLSFIREWRSILKGLTMTLAAKHLAEAPEYKMHFSDGTSRRQTAIQNSILQVAGDAGYKTVCLSSSIIALNESSIGLTQAILRTFEEGREFLASWRKTTKELYPDKEYLVNQIPEAKLLTLAKLAHGAHIMTDTCSPARLFRKLLMKEIKKIAQDEGMDDSEIEVYESDC